MDYHYANIKDIKIGRGLPIAVQTMTNTKTQDIEASVKQCIEASNAGADIIRLTTQGFKEVEALAVIKERLRASGIETPLVADVHFSADVALAVAKIADKVRINPGNFAKEKETADNKFAELLQICKEYGTAIRIGINHGSLGERIVSLYGDSPLGMMQAALEWIELGIEHNFYNVVISLKASNTVVMVEAYRLLDKELKKRGISFPLHLGVTEAGNGDMGRIKSAVGIGTLLKERIGNTLRVSLTENPVNEIAPGRILANYYNPATTESEGFAVANIMELLLSPKNNLSGSKELKNRCDSFGVRMLNGLLHRSYHTATYEEFIIKAACDFGSLLLDKRIDDFSLSVQIDGVPADNSMINMFKENLLQATRRKFSHPEYIACPGCGRPLYNLEQTFNEVKRRTAHLKGVKIAVMGCIVNGPGEMADADFGYVGEGAGRVTLYKGKEVMERGIPQEKAIDKLLELIGNS